MFHILSKGYDGGPALPTITEAREALREIVDAEVDACKRRFGRATKIKHSEDAYVVKIGGRDSESLWSSHCIVKA